MEKKARKKRVKSEGVDFKKLFRFQSFSERIASIKVDVAHRVQHTAELPEDHETFFGEGLQKWTELNCTLDFVAFQQEVRNLAGNLVQLLYHKDQIIASLKKCLLVENSLAYEPLLDLLVQLARDLQSDFYPHFKEFFPLLISICNTQDADLIQNIFTTLAYLFKFLWCYMLKDITNVYSLYSELLSQSQKSHIRHFAVESFGFLLRKVRNHDGLFTTILSSLAKQPELTEGVGQLLFEVCKGVPKQFHSCTGTLLPLLLGKLGDPELPSELVFQCLTKMVQLMAEHTRREHSDVVWTALLTHLSVLHSRWREGEESDTLSRQLAHTLHLVGTMVAWRNGSRMATGGQVTESLLDILSEPALPGSVLSVALHLAASLVLISSAIPDCQPLLVRVVEGVCGRVEEVGLVLAFFQEVADRYPKFQEEILPACLRYCELVVQREENEESIFHFLCDLCVHFEPQSTDSFTTNTSCSTSPCFIIGLEQVSSRVLKRSNTVKRRRTATESRVVAALRKRLDSELHKLKQKLTDCVDKSTGCCDVGGGCDDFHCSWASLVCLQHIRPVSRTTVNTVKELYCFLSDTLLRVSDRDSHGLEQLVLTYAQSVSTLVATLEEGRELTRVLTLDSLMTVLRNHPSSPAVLRSMCQYAQASSRCTDETFTAERLVEVLPFLQQNLSSPSSSVRLLTLRILCSFKQLPLVVESEMDLNEDGTAAEVTILKTCLHTEEIPAELESYREKLLWLEKLKYLPHRFRQLPEIYREVPLRYLIGMLYVNFRLVWEPASEIISSYAVDHNAKFFWSVFGSFLEVASNQAADKPPHPDIQPLGVDKTWHSSTLATFKYQSTLMVSMEHGRPDRANFRRLLWKCVGRFSELAESRSRILVPLIFRFIQNEYALMEDNLREFQDLRRVVDDLKSSSVEMGTGVVGSECKEGQGMEQEESEGETAATCVCDPLLEATTSGELERMEVDGGEAEEEESERGQSRISSSSRKRQPTAHSGGRNLTKTLMTILTVFSKFRNPKAFYRQEELWQLYLKLLTHKDSEVQQLALACLMTYKPPYLLPYRENFERLLDDTSFRTELENFSADSACSVVAEEHRESLTPILVRLLYGRMQRQGGHNTTRAGGAARRGIVLRFLGGCQERELAEFISLLLVPFQSLLGVRPGGDYTVEIERVIPLKKQQGFVTMLGQMLPTLGSKVKPFLEMLFSVLLKLGASCAQLLEQRVLIQSHFVKALKVLRQLIINRVSECYDSFTDFEFTSFQAEVFKSIVWPQLLKLPQECIQHPTPLMKLLHTWSKYPRYFHLLSELVPLSLLESTSLDPSGGQPLTRSILYYVFSCLSSPGVNQKLCSFVMEMVVSLLCEQELGERIILMHVEKMEVDCSQHDCDVISEDSGGREFETATSLPAEGAWQIQHSTSTAEGSSPRVCGGVELIVPFIPVLLKYLGSVIRRDGRSSLQLEFSVLSKISSCVKDSTESGLQIGLLLPFLLNSNQRFKKNEENMLLSICSLVTNVEKVAGFYRPLSQLFFVLSSRQSRTILCDIFQGLAKKDPQWRATADTVVKLNAWDEKHIEEPAYEVRLTGFSEAKQALKTPGDWTVNSVLPVLHNALFFLLQCEDMSVRDAAASYVSDLIAHIQLQDGEAFHVLVLGTIVGGVKQGIRSRHEFARHESISLLSQVVRAYPSHPRFTNMINLTHKDPEVDFFENIKHIQQHRRTRALRRLAEVCAEGSLTQASIMSFLLPLASQVVFTPSTNAEQNLVAEAVSVIRTVSAHLQWPSYCFLLCHYLRQLPKRKDIQKTLIKAVVAILDAFHFDLSDAKQLEEGNEPSQLSPNPLNGRVRSDGVSAPTEHPSQEMGKKSDEKKDEGESELVLMEGEEREELDVEQKIELETTDSTVKRNLPQKIHKTIVHSILPSLQAVLTKRIDVPSHKLSRVDQDEQSEILRVPVAMAMTKLLLALPESTLHAHLSSLLLKVCQTLKNRSRNVRDIARDTLVKMATALGPSYLPYIIREMKDLLTRGYQLHVLSYSLHSVLNGISSALKTGDLDPCMENISQILIEDLFGAPAEERASDAGVARIPESKAPQSLSSYEIVTRFLSPAQLPNLLDSVKQVLETRSTLRVSRVVEEIFRRVALGIQSNEGFTPQAFLVFIHDMISDSVPQLAKKPSSKSHIHPSPLSHHDSYLLPPTPTRTGPKPVTQGNIAAYITTEFGLQLLHAALKHNKFDTSKEEQLQMLDPFVPLLSDSLTSRHLKVLSRALHCLTWVVKLPLPSLDTHIHTISSNLFDLLRRYSRTGAAVGSNRELVLAAFKAMTVVLRDFKGHNISEDELKLLLSFVEEDIHDYQRQSTAFPLLKTILGRRLVAREMYELMHKVAELSVTAESERVRQQSRQAVVQFIMDYPLGKKLHKYLDFYVANLSYEEQSGRESVIELLAVIFNKFPERLIHRHAIYFFIPLTSQLVNDESPTCRQMIAEAVKTLVRRLDTAKRNDVVNMIEVWISHDKLIHKQLGVQTLGLMVEVEGQAFERRLPMVLPLLSSCLSLYNSYESEGQGNDIHDVDHGTVTQDVDREVETVGARAQSMLSKYEKKEKEEEEEVVEEEEEEEEESNPEATSTALDHLLFSTLSTLEKICNECSVLRIPIYRDHMNMLWEVVEVLLLHPHTWVRLSACRLFGLLFASYQPEELASSSTAGGATDKKRRGRGKRGQLQSVVEYILQDSVLKVQNLCGSFCMQLSSPLLNTELANQAVKNLVFLAKVLHRLELVRLLPTFENGDIRSDARDVSYHSDHLVEHDHKSDQADDIVNDVVDDDDQAGILSIEAGWLGFDAQDGEVYESTRRQHVRNLPWLIGRLSRIAKYEAGHHPKESLKRMSVLQWVAAISLDLQQEQLSVYLPALLRPVYRELADTNQTAGEGLYTLAREVMDLVKSVSGREIFSKAYAQVHQSVLATREKRRKQAALEAVANPEKTIRRKQRKNLLKKASKMRKIATHRPGKKIRLHH